ncbi:HD domain-containing phosphohydrolase [Marinomonas posidonica]|uniref:Response regulator receiver modulated metal dependent phosphohydrolase n=1 Tax=Marinomonas posidonica (strain CECT 7376 / NCIMB 14433 / IVIA-Po-181) TaxID=491952 RepID=F6CSC7_MARPP|nr:HD domain-containing phosphohydrolase [Marinomonas posidonica]AEF54981.1 response regulator receiver modulated metal dependent phosphohydrolase [Marinomonas posidonica IVIA-Po-181]
MSLFGQEAMNMTTECIDMLTDKKKVLIVDDVPRNIDLLKEILAEHYQVQVAKNGVAALNIIAASEPDIVLLDVMMPGMSGFEVCEKLKSQNQTANIPVIFLTATTDMKYEIEGFRVGAVDFITKPISPMTTLSRVATHLKLSENDKQNKAIIAARTQQLDDALEAAVTMLGEVGHLNDTDTGIHMWRMADYSAALARAAGWEEEQVELLRMAAPMHDTGKVAIPDSILKSPHKLTDDEMEIMKSHTVAGHNILSKSNAPLFQLAAQAALGHHEKWDGSGYPYGLAARAIPQSARIVAMADVFDALTMERSYKKSWTVEEALVHIERSAGSHFDPELVRLFLSIKDELIRIQKKWHLRELEQAN